MNHSIVFKRRWLTLAALLLCDGFILDGYRGAAARGAEMQPIAVLSFSGYQRFVADVAALGETAKLPKLTASLSGFLKRRTGVESLEGLDLARPMGIVVATDGLAVVPVAFVPVADSGKLLKSLEKLIDKPQRLGEGTWKIGREKVTGFVRHRGDWLYVAQSEDQLGWLPDPVKTLRDLPKRFDVALEVNWQHVPDVFRTMGVDLLRLSMRNNLKRREKESESAHQLRHRVATWQFRLWETLLTESRQVTLGWTVDERGKQAILDLRLAPEPDSSLAKQLAALRGAKTRFGGLVRDDSPLAWQVNWSLNTTQVEKLGGDLSASREALVARIGELEWIKSPAEKETFQHVAGSVLDVLGKTIRSSQLDVALAVTSGVSDGKPPRDPKDGSAPAKTDAASGSRPLTILGAAFVGEGEPLRQAFEAVARLGDKDPRFAGFRRNVAKVEGKNVHAIILPEPPDTGGDMIVQRLFGKQPMLYVLTTEDSICAAIGPDALERLRIPLRHEPAEAPPLKFVARMGAAADVLERTWGANYFTPLAASAKGADDRVTLTVKHDEGQLHARLVGHEGILKSSAAALDLALSVAQLFGGR